MQWSNKRQHVCQRPYRRHGLHLRTYTDSGCTKLIATTSPITAKSASQASASPGPVASVTASRSGGGIVAGWDAVVNATKYHVTYSTDGGSSWSLAADAHQSNSITIANADDGLAYIVGVRAGNDIGWGPGPTPTQFRRATARPYRRLWTSAARR